MCPVEVAEEHPPTRPCAGRLRSWHRADLAEGPSLPQLSPPAGHRRSKSGWGGESWSRGPSRRTPRGHAGLSSWPSRRPEGGLHSHVFLGKALGVPGRRAWPPSPQSSDRPGVPLGRRVPRGTHLSPDSSRREADVGDACRHRPPIGPCVHPYICAVSHPLQFIRFSIPCIHQNPWGPIGKAHAASGTSEELDPQAQTAGPARRLSWAPAWVRSAARFRRYTPGEVAASTPNRERRVPGGTARTRLRAEIRTQQSGGGGECPATNGQPLLRRDPLLPAGTQRVCLVHPEVKWGPGKTQGTRAEWQVAEARALVCTLDGWSVVDTMVVPTKTPDKKLIFGRGTLEQLTERIRGSPEITSVFLNVERLATPTKKDLEAAWRVPVFDRFTVVLHIFRCNARTKEARLQVALAELPLLRCEQDPGQCRRTPTTTETLSRDPQPGPSLGRPPPPRPSLGTPNRDLRKTTLIKALTGDAAIQPRNQLFATLDITAHAGRLPSALTVLYMDTIGFLSQLPHSLVESFSATLQDVAHSDLIVHVRDVSHPETELQKASVLSALRGLGLPDALLESMVEVHNKVDLVPGYTPAEPDVLAVSALLGLGLDELMARGEDAVLRATGRRTLTLRVRLAGPQLRSACPAWPARAHLHESRRVHHVDEVQVPLRAVLHVCDPQVQVPHASIQLLRDAQHLHTGVGHRCRAQGGPASARRRPRGLGPR
ncbi:PREDICTED: putative GTP-binding protein 6 [Bison bison bison]|uniref:Putative GTP-binding protein 6 n=1 Tax=Bison bison bison TaxID=43346 RepID=A0A6P3GRB9_BISBB|nr:PREDICTED: putative GTP-binding protein 6 [Bison bison bison]